MRFEKWQALGNDYIVIERDELAGAAPEQCALELTPARIRRICDAHFGVGGDGVLLLERCEDGDSVARLTIYNPDGSRAELSGNGAREAILYLRHCGWTDRDEFTLQTDAGPVSPRITGPDTCTVDMGQAALTSKDFLDGPADGAGEIDAAGQRWSFRHVSIGNPQCAIAMPNLQSLLALDLAAIGPAIEGDARFPNRTNVSWYTELPPLGSTAAPSAPGTETQPAGSWVGRRGSGRIRARIFERGVGETLASGTGATGAAIAYLLQGAASPVSVLLDGGELLVEVSEDLRVKLTGWARPVFAGRLSDELVKELYETE